jgi:aquaporin Z
MIEHATRGPFSPKVANRSRAVLGLEFPATRDFDDTSLEWRRLFSELFGTFLLVAVAAGGGVLALSTHGQVSRAAAVTAPGLMVMAIILFMGAVSGAHLNPAVTISFTLRGDFPWRRVPGYILVQLIGASLACLFVREVLGGANHLGATLPGTHVADWKAMVIELFLTLGLVSTILGTASRAQNVGTLSAVAVGGYVALAGLWSSPVSGASMNPARSFGPDLIRGDFAHFWVYLVGPLLGGALAVGAAWVLRGPGGDPGGLSAAQGGLEQIVRAGLAAGAGGPDAARTDTSRPAATGE